MKSAPNFTGTWLLNAAKSTMRGGAGPQMVVDIDHREPTLFQNITLTLPDGQTREQMFACRVGVETVNTIGGAALRSTARWEDTELVIESRLQMPDREAYFKDCWSLSDDGKTLTMAHRDDDLAGQIAVLERENGADG